jgi:hypothetical protein
MAAPYPVAPTVTRAPSPDRVMRER